MQYTLTGAHIVVYVNNTIFKEVQSISFNVDYGEKAISGIDSPYPQELAVTSVSVSGTMNLVRVKNSNGLQAKTMRPLYTDLAASPYVSIRITDRQSGEDILFMPKAKVTSESHTASTKAVYRVNLGFTAIVPLFPLDRA